VHPKLSSSILPIPAVVGKLYTVRLTIKFQQMKKLLSVLIATVLLVACGNNDTDNNDVEVESAPVTPGLDNVDGNVPDTNRTIRLNTPLPNDSVTGTAADSVPPGR
jgi:hypothetical protein